MVSLLSQITQSWSDGSQFNSLTLVCCNECITLYYMCVRACVRVCVCVCVRECVYISMNTRLDKRVKTSKEKG